MSKTMLYHWPAPLPEKLDSGSKLHLVRMLEGFREIGYEVEVVAGNGAQRGELASKIKREVAAGRRFDFVFSESLSIPTLLTERHHLPTHPGVDFGLLGWLRSRGTPVGLFYGDVYWRFPYFTALRPGVERVLVDLFYRYDVWQYRRVLDHLFVPAVGMAALLPGGWPAERVSALLPGCTVADLPSGRRAAGEGGLRIFYVGGSLPPLYNLAPLFEATRSLEGVSVQVCCRAEEWATARAAYGGEVGEGVQVVHISGPGLAELYAEADLFSMVFEPNSYRAVTVPVKLFECLGYATPVVTMVGAGGPAQTETARLIAEYGLGWVVGSVEELRALLERLRDDPAPIAAQRAHLAELRPRHTWAARAQYVADTLTGSRAPELRSS